MGIMLAKIHNIQLKKYDEIETEWERDEPYIYLDNLKQMNISTLNLTIK